MSLSGSTTPFKEEDLLGSTKDLLSPEQTSHFNASDPFTASASDSLPSSSQNKDINETFGGVSDTLPTGSVNKQDSNATTSASKNLEMGSSVWEKALERLSGLVDQQIFNAYLKPLHFKELETSHGIFVLTSPSAFIRNQVERAYKETVELSLQHVYGSRLELRVLIDFETGFRDSKGFSESKKQQGPIFVKKFELLRPLEGGAPAHNTHANQFTKTAKPLAKPARTDMSGPDATSPIQNEKSSSFGISINQRYTFDSFVVGNNNQFCHAAAMRVAETPGLSYNPLFIYGGVGLGKTHLLHAMGNAVLKRNPSAKVLYLSSEAFTNELILSLRNAKMEEFKARMRGIELLLIDDIQFISGKERTQEEFFHTFNALYNCKHQIVITSDKMPQDIPGLEERLKTRFSWGLTADIQAPDYETRVAILKRKAFTDGCELPEEVAAYIAHNVSSNVRELEGAFTKLHALSSLQNLKVTLELAQTALKPLLQPKVRNYSIDDIKKAVSEHFNIRVSEMVSKRRTKNLSFPRHVAMYLCRKHTTASYPEIGFQFGGRDHSSVIHAASVVSDKVSADAAVRDAVTTIERRLQG